MKLTLTLRALAVSLTLLSASFLSHAQTSASGTCSSAIYFGTPQETGGVCVGRGVCHEVSGGVNVAFVINQNNPNIIMMIFSLSELTQKQPDQVSYFTSGSYMFDAAFNLSADPAFAPLNLPANSQILPTSPSIVQITGDIVVDYIQYSPGS